jgi:glucose-1-phosphate cytidylyltransferase
MKTIILAGGSGTRFSEETEKVPKPMIKVHDKPILLHIMNIYAKYGYRDFGIALGYKADYIKNFFLTTSLNNLNLNISFTKNENTEKNIKSSNWNVTLVDTGLNSMTGGRLKRMKSYISKDPFFLTYGDGVADINLDELLDFHKKHKKMVTVTAVRPAARFGELKIDSGLVKSFKEKPQTDQGWINGGFFVINPEFLEIIKDDNTILEKGPLEQVCKMEELMAYKHYSYWQCMDTKRDRDQLEELIQKKNAPWI